MQNNFNKRLLNIFMAVLCVFSILSGVKPVAADAAPPEMAPGSDLEAGQSTKVRMAEEVVIFDLTKLNRLENSSVPVTATFTMFNDGKEDEEMMVRFPLGCDEEDYSKATEFEVMSNGKSLPVRISTSKKPVFLPMPPYYSRRLDYCKTSTWVEFPVVFPKKENVSLQVHYMLEVVPLGATAAFGYYLQTGSGWNGEIGKGTFIVRLPYETTIENISCNWNSTRAFSPEYKGKEIIWKFSNLEPTTKNNLIFQAIFPDQWQPVIDAQNAISQSPYDATAYVQLGDAYHSVAWGDHGAVDHYFSKRSIYSYEKALALDSYQIDAHNGIASMLWDEQWNLLISVDQEGKFLKPIFEHLSIVFAIDPENARAQMLLGEINQGHDFILPTVNPVLLPSPTATPSPFPTETPEPG
ncbi:hypothetical protein hrd7_08600 [Leptolinea sp. HRD-7]|nr:hypothetical protein hrd7_08600 [Leptolinea sp. HRD-7]